MKNLFALFLKPLTGKCLFSAFGILLLSIAGFAQNIEQKRFEKIDLSFNLSSASSNEAVGFNNSKSSWKVDYALYIADFAGLETIGKCGLFENRQVKTCSNLTDKKLDKKIRKIAKLVSKGKVSRKNLSPDSNRNFVETITLKPEINSIFDEASKVNDKNPVLIFYVNARVSTKNQEGAKLKKKYKTEGLRWLKNYQPDKTILYSDLSKLSFKLEVEKRDDGTLNIRVGYVHFG